MQKADSHGSQLTDGFLRSATMAISISPETERALKEAVCGGHFGSQEEALSEAIRLLRDSTNSNGSARALLTNSIRTAAARVG